MLGYMWAAGKEVSKEEGANSLKPSSTLLVVVWAWTEVVVRAACTLTTTSMLAAMVRDWVSF